DAAGEQRGQEPPRRPRLEESLLHRDRVAQVAALAADGLGERDPEQALRRRGPVELARHLAGVLPLLQVRRDLAAHELPRGLLQRLAFPGHTSESSIATIRERTHSP